ncbi:MAG: class I SAM-dependent methyltransferase [Candidatus Heimdallarchaeota archaeon]|nr:class I SAM-dependent methyltransferase [Candidatus Heimdallarchaeota archaeon]
MKIFKIYSEYARAYHEMYQSIFDYEEEFKIYDKYLSKIKAKKILELGCGSGNMAKLFIKNKYDYIGLDCSKEMIALSKEFVPKGKFLLGDMRNLELEETFDAVLVTGRTFTHMTTNHDVMFALNSIHEVLNHEGWLIFDNFDASIIFTDFRETSQNKTMFENRKYLRLSETSFDFNHGWTWKWKSHYEVIEEEKKEEFEDEITLRAFTEDELRLFLSINGFKVCNMEKSANAILTVAQKINEEKTNAQNIYFKQKLNDISET